METAQHHTRTAPLCINCRHLSPVEASRRRLCNHPAMPVDLVSGQPRTSAADARALTEQTARLVKVPLCGANGLLFAEVTA